MSATTYGPASVMFLPSGITLDQARHELGIKMPVRIELRERVGIGSKAKYMGVVGGTHRIAIGVGKQRLPKIGSWLNLPSANETVWHELKHAAQCELHFGGDSDRAAEHYAEHIRLRLEARGYTLPDDFFIGGLGRMVDAERRTTGRSAIFEEYEASWWEVEARETATRYADVLVTFPLSRRTRKDAFGH